MGAYAKALHLPLFLASLLPCLSLQMIRKKDAQKMIHFMLKNYSSEARYCVLVPAAPQVLVADANGLRPIQGGSPLVGDRQAALWTRLFFGTI